MITRLTRQQARKQAAPSHDIHSHRDGDGEPDSASDSGSDSDIPATKSPHKSLDAPGRSTLRPRRVPKRPFQDIQASSSGSQKGPKKFRRGQLPTPNSAQIAQGLIRGSANHASGQPAEDVSESASEDVEYAPSADMLRLTNDGYRGSITCTTAPQLPSDERPDGEDRSEGDEAALGDQDAHGEQGGTVVIELDDVILGDEPTQSEAAAYLPVDRRHSSAGESSGIFVSGSNDSQDEDYQPDQPGGEEQHSLEESDEAGISPELREGRQAGADADQESQRVNRIESRDGNSPTEPLNTRGHEHDNSPEIDTDVDVSVSNEGVPKPFFDCEVRRFRDSRRRHKRRVSVSADNDASTDDAFLTIHLPNTYINALSKLMCRKGWAALPKGQKNLARDGLHTEGGDRLFRSLIRIDLLCSVAPRPERVRERLEKIKEQTIFLHEHRDFQEHYCNKIDKATRRILHEMPIMIEQGREAGLQGWKAMSNDLVRILIPLFIRVLRKAWSLGGDLQRASQHVLTRESYFTASTVSLLAKISNSLQMLYGRLMTELKRRPLEECPADVSRQPAWSEEKEQREAAKNLLDGVLQILRFAQGQLQERKERARRKREAEIEEASRMKRRLEQEALHRDEQRRQLLLTQKKIAEEIERAAVDRAAAVNKQNRMVALSIRAMASASVPPSSFASSSVSSLNRRAGTSRAPAWTWEEEISLCNRLKQALEHYPRASQLPELAGTAMSVAHDMAETRAKSRTLLNRMLSAQQPWKRASEIEVLVDDLMKQWA